MIKFSSAFGERISGFLNYRIARGFKLKTYKAWSNSKLDGKFPNSIRVYDLRHQFASACLNRWLDNGENLMAMLPFLRTYMGHQTLSQTAYYIHILPESITKSSAIDWDKFNEMFPEVAE